jgi:thiol-disulfide isomerase/thioredoxin
VSFEVAALVAAWLTITLLAFAMAGLYAQVRGLTAGGVAPAGSGGRMFAPSMSDGRVPTDSLVLFLSTTCQVCRDLIREVSALRENGVLPGSRVLAVFAVDSAADIPPWAAAAGIETRADPTFANRFRVAATPTVAYIDPDGVVAHLSPVASTERFRDAVQRLAAGDHATDDEHPRSRT